MGRARRTLSEPCCYHVTHRCQERRFLLRFEIDRRAYVGRLRELVLRYPVELLDYMVTCNHVHLLLWARHARDVSAGMHFLQGNSARDYNRRKGREGSFWRGRYHPTLVETGTHVSRCLFYIGLNMVRAGAVAHPEQWRSCGYHELCGRRQRYRIVNRERLFWALGLPEVPDREERFRDWYTATLEELVQTHYLVRESAWSEAAAIGSRGWLNHLGAGRLGREVHPLLRPRISELREQEESYGLSLPVGEQRDFWTQWQREAGAA